MALVTLLILVEGALAGILEQSHFLVAGEVAWRNLTRWEERLEAGQDPRAHAGLSPAYRVLTLERGQLRQD